MNGVTVGYIFDVHQRLSQVFSPWDGASGTRGLNVNYTSMTDPLTAANQPARSLRAVPEPGAERDAVVLRTGGDGSSRPQHKAEVDSTGNGTAASGVIVSGKKTYDAVRAPGLAGDAPVPVGDADRRLPGLSILASRNPTSFTYDVLSRKTKITYPGTTRPPATNAYNLVSVNGVLRKQWWPRTRTDRSCGRTPIRATTWSWSRRRIRSAASLKPQSTDHVRVRSAGSVAHRDRRQEQQDHHQLGQRRADGRRDERRHRQDVLRPRPEREPRAQAERQGQPHRLSPDQEPAGQHHLPDQRDGDLQLRSAGGCGSPRRPRWRTASDEAGTESYTYDDYGNVTQTQFTPAPPSGAPTPPTYQTDYTYDPTTGTLRTVQVGGAPETIAYSYNAQGLVNSVNGFPTVTQSESPTHYAGKIDYDEFGKRTRIELGNGVTTTYAYDSLTRRLSNLNTTTGSGAIIQKNDLRIRSGRQRDDHGEHGRGAALQHAVHNGCAGADVVHVRVRQPVSAQDLDGRVHRRRRVRRPELQRDDGLRRDRQHHQQGAVGYAEGDGRCAGGDPDGDVVHVQLYVRRGSIPTASRRSAARRAGPRPARTTPTATVCP